MVGRSELQFQSCELINLQYKVHQYRSRVLQRPKGWCLLAYVTARNENWWYSNTVWDCVSTYTVRQLEITLPFIWNYFYILVLRVKVLILEQRTHGAKLFKTIVHIKCGMSIYLFMREYSLYEMKIIFYTIYKKYLLQVFLI